MSRFAFLCVLAATLVACSEDGSLNPGTDGGAVADGGSDAAPGLPDAFVPAGACDDLPTLPASFTHMPSITVSEDFTFDAEGNIVGVSTETHGLKKTRYDGTSTIVMPDVSNWGRGVRILANGDYLVAEPDGSQLVRITPSGSQTTVVSGITEPNGLVVHPNGIAFLTSGSSGVRRIDPDTGDFTIVYNPGGSYDGIAFSVDFRTLYFNSESGQVYSVALDADAMPIGTPQPYVEIPVTEILDGMAVDECNNLYVVEMTGVVWRVTPDKQITEAVVLGGDGPGGPGGFAFICAINFGSGVGGWKDDHLYIMNLGGGVYEADLGVRGQPAPHLP